MKNRTDRHTMAETQALLAEVQDAQDLLHGDESSVVLKRGLFKLVGDRLHNIPGDQTEGTTVHKAQFGHPAFHQSSLALPVWDWYMLGGEWLSVAM